MKYKRVKDLDYLRTILNICMGFGGHKVCVTVYLIKTEIDHIQLNYVYVFQICLISEFNLNRVRKPRYHNQSTKNTIKTHLFTDSFLILRSSGRKSRAGVGCTSYSILHSSSLKVGQNPKSLGG